MARKLFTCGFAGLHVARVLSTLGLVALFKTGSILILARVLFHLSWLAYIWPGSCLFVAWLPYILGHCLRLVWLPYKALSNFGSVALHLACALFNSCWGSVYFWLGWLTFGEGFVYFSLGCLTFSLGLR